MFTFTLMIEVAIYLAGIKNVTLSSVSGSCSVPEACRGERCPLYLEKILDKAGESGKVPKC